MTPGNLDVEEGSHTEANARFLRGLEVTVDYGDQALLAHLLEGFSGPARGLDSTGGPSASEGRRERWRGRSSQRRFIRRGGDASQRGGLLASHVG